MPEPIGRDLQAIFDRALANKDKFTAVDWAGAQMLMARGAVMTRHAYDPGTGLNEYYFSWNGGELKFKYSGTKPMRDQAA